MPKPDSTTEPLLVTEAPEVVVLVVALADGFGAGDADADALADGCGALDPFGLTDSDPADPAATLAEALGSGSLVADGVALDVSLTAGAAKPPLATTASWPK